MNNRDRIAKAIKLVRPVHASVQTRRPSGVSMPVADNITTKLVVALHNLEGALELYPEPAAKEKK